ncbi:hypothetical protein FXO37_04514 [Capsicum annuum]|nr:hypothetical protein FXO37_04514 [Capsicum annuum]
MIEARRTFHIGLIRYAAKPLARPMQDLVDIMVGMFPQDNQMDAPAIAEATKAGAKMEGAHTQWVLLVPHHPYSLCHLGHEDRRVQGCLDAFELRQVGSGKTPNVANVRSKITEIKKMVAELYEKLGITELV